jgi:hypothetical protein
MPRHVPRHMPRHTQVSECENFLAHTSGNELWVRRSVWGPRASCPPFAIISTGRLCGFVTL